MKKKSLLMVLALTFMSAMVFVSCGSKEAEGPTEQVLSKKLYTKVVNEYDYVRDEFHCGLCVVKNGTFSDPHYGAIDAKGKLVVPLDYSSLEDFIEGIAKFKKKVEGKEFVGYVDTKGNEVVPPIYCDGGDFSEGLARVAIEDAESTGWAEDKLWGFVNKKGEVVVPLVYKYADDFSSGLAPVKEEKKYGYINGKGETIIPFNYDDASSFSEKLAIVEKGEKEMVIDEKGEVVYVLPDNQAFPLFSSYNNGLVPVKKLIGDSWWNDEDIRCGYLNTKGEVAIDFVYDDVDNFEDGVAKVEKGSRTIYINTKGEEVPDPED